MKKTFFTLSLFLFFGNYVSAQAFDIKTYTKLVNANKEEFISFAKSAGLTTDYDETSQTLFATQKGCVYGKPLGDKNNNEYYDLVLLISTLDKANNKLILAKAKESTEKKGIWTDDQYLYREWDMENPETKEMWYKVLVYKKKR